MKWLDLFAVLPFGVKQEPIPFNLSISGKELQNFQTLLQLSPIADETFENLQTDQRFGVSREWVLDTKDYWSTTFDWRAQEAKINSYPNFKTRIADDDGEIFDIHFTALFSSNASAIPISFFHGWPGSFLEFLPLLDLVSSKYRPEDLPYHIIVPSLPGFTLSSGPPSSKDWTVADSARIMHKLLVSLGFDEKGYIVQGGDVGSYVARIMAATYPECKGLHVNFLYPLANGSQSGPQGNLTDAEEQGLDRFQQFLTTGSAYMDMHRTRPATTGLVMASSPIAHLVWIGEKFLSWSDPTTLPSLDEILTNINLYWFTGSLPTSVYPYRDTLRLPYVNLPTGYSYFPKEVAPVPRAWATEAVNLVFFKSHESGGHFAALEMTEALWNDIDKYVKVVRVDNQKTIEGE